MIDRENGKVEGEHVDLWALSFSKWPDTFLWLTNDISIL
jgi:hypothetical protein